jgi:hypothetical protein
MRRRVYLETTIVSYLTARPRRTVVEAAHQQITLDWWQQRRHEFDLVVSGAVKLAEYLAERERFLPFICTPEELLGAEE